MRIEIDFEGGKNAAGIYVHKKLPEAMGNSVAAFAHAVLSGHTQPGVWYPEEKEALAVSVYCGGAPCCFLHFSASLLSCMHCVVAVLIGHTQPGGVVSAGRRRPWRTVCSWILLPSLQLLQL